MRWSPDGQLFVTGLQLMTYYLNEYWDVEADRLNVNGGAIALGHPIGCTGARIVVTLLHEMKKRGSRRGLATLCVSGGMGMAMAFEKC